MNIKIAPQKVERKNFTFSSEIKKKPCCIEILRVEMNDKYTRIDFLYKNRYGSGGWCQISRDTFIRVLGKKKNMG